VFKLKVHESFDCYGLRANGYTLERGFPFKVQHLCVLATRQFVRVKLRELFCSHVHATQPSKADSSQSPLSLPFHLFGFHSFFVQQI